jgi:hypothetical protein
VDGFTAGGRTHTAVVFRILKKKYDKFMTFSPVFFLEMCKMGF